MNKYLIFGVILLVIVAGGFYLFKKDWSQPAVSNGTPETPEIVQTETPKPAPSTGAVVRYSNSGFSPNTIGVKVGTTVTFINDSAEQMWVASAFHPTHQVLPGFDQLKWVGADGTYQYTFTKAGDWKYHNHLNPKHFGTVVTQ